MGVFDDDIETAKELIAEFGQDCWWQKPADPVDPDSGVPGYPGEEDDEPDPIPCKIAFFSPKDLDMGVNQFLQYMVSSEVPENSQIGLLAGGLSFTPELTDTIRRGADSADPISIEAIELLAPNGTPVLYYVRVTA